MSGEILNVEAKDSISTLLELAANDDVEDFKRFSDKEPFSIDKVGVWYGRQRGSNQMILLLRTPLMVAATYGSTDVLKLIVSLHVVDLNRSCGVDKTTALHCAASSGSANSVDNVKLLLEAGADPGIADDNGLLPFDVIIVPPKDEEMKYSLRIMLTNDALFQETHDHWVSTGAPNSNLQQFPSSPGNGSPCSPSELSLSLKNAKFNDTFVPPAREKKEYPIDPSLPDIKNSIYSTDEFRMFSFKVRPCSRAYSHDWTECPFVHPGENARRRDPRKFHYSCVPCPDFRKGACGRGDMCEYAHGVFECWLHPAHYRTRLCKDGTNCDRRVCFFAHTQEELRPLHFSSGSSFPSPRSIASGSNPVDFAAAMNLLRGSPSIPVMSPSPFTPPMSPSTNGVANSGWSPQQNVPLLHLPGSNFQCSRLRSSLNARDIPPEDLSLFPDIDIQQKQLLQELSFLSESSINISSLNNSTRSKIPISSNREDYISAEKSPRYSDHAMPLTAFSPTCNSAAFHQFQQQQQSMLSPIKTNHSPRNVEQSLRRTPFCLPSPGRMSPRSIEPISPMSARMSMVAQSEKQHQQFRSLSSRDLGYNAAAATSSFEETLSGWGSPNGIPEWTVHDDEFGKLKRSSFETHIDNEGPKVSWAQSVVKESFGDKDKSAPLVVGSHLPSAEGENLNQIQQIDQSILGAWLEQLQFDQLMAQ